MAPSRTWNRLAGREGMKVDAPRTVPRAFVSWAHRDPGWTADQAAAWEQEVLALAVTLRSLGVDVDIDLFHQHERGIDWNRYGPQQVRERDVVIVAASRGWRERWEGRNDPRVGAGAVAEADTLLSIFNENQQTFREKVLVIILPSMVGREVLPDRLGGVSRVELTEFSPASMEPLLRLLLAQPKYEVPERGELPELAPVPAPPSPPASAGDPVRELDERIGVLKGTLSRLPEPEPGEGPHLPWWRAGQQVQGQLVELERERRELARRVGADTSGPASEAAPGPISVSVAVAGEAPPAREVLDRAAPPPGAPDHRMVYDGMLMLRVVAIAVPANLRHPQGAALVPALGDASEAVVELRGRWPNRAQLLLARRLGEGWRALAPHLWGAGRTSGDAEALVRGATAAVSYTSRPGVFCVDCTWPTTVIGQDGSVAYYAAHEPEVTGEAVGALVLATGFWRPVPGLQAVDVALQLAGGASGGRLVSAEHYTSASDPFGEPHEGIVPVPEAPTHYLDVGRFSFDDLSTPERVVDELLGPWLAVFRERDLFVDLGLR